MKCPACDSENLHKEKMYVLALGKSVKNCNYTQCLVCGLQGKACCFGAKDILPLAGTEGWSEEKIKNFMPYLQKRLSEEFASFTHLEEISE